ncbi:uncharacterized protein LOC135584828 [Musa acuminata AAA Group]|uniref:uncharacterized protein LOC135584828 n=1 Tax=Musa acuminata AAA Group TaxID=214697 RepID=UPI0031D13DC3
MSSVEKKRGVPMKGEVDGVSASKEVRESKKEKRRRLILSDTDSDDCLVSLQEVDCETAQNGDSLSIGEDNGVEGMKEKENEKEKVEVERKKKKVLRLDVVKPSEEFVVADKNEVIEPVLESKRSREPADVEGSAKRPKRDFSELGRIPKTPNGGNKSKTYSSHGDDKKEMKVDFDIKPLVPASRERYGVENHIQSNSHSIHKKEDEKVKSIESSGDQALQMKDGSSSFASKKRADTSISLCKDGVLRVQGKGGVLRVLPSNKKVDGFGNLHSKSKVEGKSNTFISPRIATRSTLKKSSLSPDRRVHEKSSSGATLNKHESKKAKVDIAEESTYKKPQTDSPKREKKRSDMPRGRAGFKIKGGTSMKTAFMAKQELSKASVTRNTEKQKLRDQIKAILLNAGWTIDLRPRKGRNYEDSVYIPPEGQGGYWSITKAYAVYQEQLNRSCNERRKNSSERSSRTSAGNDYVVPMESLNILKRVVNKRRNQELEETQRSKKKEKKTSDLRHPRDQDAQDKLDEIRGRKKSNCALASNTKTAVGSIAHKHFRKGRNKQRGCALLVRGSNQEAEDEENDYVPYVWTRTVLSWMIDMGVLHINGKVKYMNQRRTKTKLEGWITRDGIYCSCCSKILTVSKFELHAGSKLLQPLQNIYLEDGGLSLLQCQLDAWKKQDESERQGFYIVDVSGDDPNDDTCGICGDGGDLICCDGCPSTFHLSCLGIEKLPPGDWHCTNCCCRYCGRISVDTIPETDETVSSLLSCHHCEAKYHQDCVPETESISATSKSRRISFCSQSCSKVFKWLQKILGTKNELEAGFSWSVIRRFDEDAFEFPLMSQLNVECNSKIAVALAVMDECFLPIVDQRSGVNLIHNVIYNCGSNFNRLNYRGFYSFILERGDEIISVASVRIHGTRLAEMPFIGTRNMYRRQGMCRRLLDGIESALFSLNVQKLVIPAISELKDTWTNVFGFKPLEVSQELEVRSINMLVFPGTGLLQKQLLMMHSSEQCAPIDGVDMVEYDIKHQHQTKSTYESSESSSVEPNLYNSGQAVVHCVNATQDTGSGLSSFKVSPGSSDSPRSECKSQEYKSFVMGGDRDTHNFPESGLTNSHDEDKSQIDFSTRELTLSDNHGEKSTEANTLTDLQESNAVSKHVSPKGFASDIQKSGASSLNMLPTQCNSLQHKYEDHCTLPEFVTVTPKPGIESIAELQICSLESTSTPLHYESHVRTKAHSPNSARGNGQISPESTHDATNHHEKSLLDHLEPSIHVDSKEMMYSIHAVEAKGAALDPNSSLNDEDSEPFAFEIVSRPINAAAGKENSSSYKSCAVTVSDKSTRLSIQHSSLDRVSITNGTVCESNLSHVVKSCKIQGDIEHSDMTCSLMLDPGIKGIPPVLTTSFEVSAEPIDYGLCAVHDASVDIKKFDTGSESSQ